MRCLASCEQPYLLLLTLTGHRSARQPDMRSTAKRAGQHPVMPQTGELLSSGLSALARSLQHPSVPRRTCWGWRGTCWRCCATRACRRGCSRTRVPRRCASVRTASPTGRLHENSGHIVAPRRPSTSASESKATRASWMQLLSAVAPPPRISIGTPRLDSTLCCGKERHRHRMLPFGVSEQSCGLAVPSLFRAQRLLRRVQR